MQHTCHDPHCATPHTLTVGHILPSFPALLKVQCYTNLLIPPKAQEVRQLVGEPEEYLKGDQFLHFTDFERQAYAAFCGLSALAQKNQEDVLNAMNNQEALGSLVDWIVSPPFVSLELQKNIKRDTLQKSQLFTDTMCNGPLKLLGYLSVSKKFIPSLIASQKFPALVKKLGELALRKDEVSQPFKRTTLGCLAFYASEERGRKEIMKIPNIIASLEGVKEATMLLRRLISEPVTSPRETTNTEPISPRTQVAHTNAEPISPRTQVAQKAAVNPKSPRGQTAKTAVPPQKSTLPSETPVPSSQTPEVKPDDKITQTVEVKPEPANQSEKAPEPAQPTKPNPSNNVPKTNTPAQKSAPQKSAPKASAPAQKNAPKTQNKAPQKTDPPVVEPEHPAPPAPKEIPEQVVPKQDTTSHAKPQAKKGPAPKTQAQKKAIPSPRQKPELKPKSSEPVGKSKTPTQVPEPVEKLNDPSKSPQSAKEKLPSPAKIPEPVKPLSPAKAPEPVPVKPLSPAKAPEPEPEPVKEKLQSPAKSPEPEPQNTAQPEPVLACVICGKEKAKRCTSCYMVAYCSKDHQRDHWPTHKPICLKNRK